MPTYSYRCQSCLHAFDIQQAFTDEPLTTCPECGKALRKIFSPVGVTFQGSGFYRTDSRSESSAKTSSEAPKSDGKPAGKSDGKAAPAKPDKAAPAATPAT